MKASAHRMPAIRMGKVSKIIFPGGGLIIKTSRGVIRSSILNGEI